MSFGVSRRYQNSNSAKLEAKSDITNNNGEYLLKLPNGRTQLLKIQTDNFGNIARVQTIGAPALPKEKRETFSPLFKPSPLNFYTEPHFKNYPPPTTASFPPPPTRNDPHSAYATAPLYATAPQTNYAQAPIRANAPLMYLSEAPAIATVSSAPATAPQNNYAPLNVQDTVYGSAPFYAPGPSVYTTESATKAPTTTKTSPLNPVYSAP